jgi:hypothetical protein
MSQVTTIKPRLAIVIHSSRVSSNALGAAVAGPCSNQRTPIHVTIHSRTACRICKTIQSDQAMLWRWWCSFRHGQGKALQCSTLQGSKHLRIHRSVIRTTLGTAMLPIRARIAAQKALGCVRSTMPIREVLLTWPMARVDTYRPSSTRTCIALITVRKSR